jgi:hypothetical protein
LDFLARGGTYRAILLAPDCATTKILSELRGENLPE